MSLLPIFLRLEGRAALVVGGGALAATRIAPLLLAGARVQVVAPAAGDRLLAWAGSGAVTWTQRAFTAADVAGRAVVFAATGVPEVDASVFVACRRWGVLCNAIDDPQHCDFYSGAVVRRGDFQIAVSTNGQSPALAQRVREELDARFGPEWTERVRQLGAERRRILASLPAGVERTRLLHARVREALVEVRAIPNAEKAAVEA